MEEDSAAIGEWVSWMELSELESELESELLPLDEEAEVDSEGLMRRLCFRTKAAIVNLLAVLIGT